MLITPGSERVNIKGEGQCLLFFLCIHSVYQVTQVSYGGCLLIQGYFCVV